MTTTPSNPRRVFLVRGTGSCGTSWITALLNLHPRRVPQPRPRVAMAEH